MLRIEDLHAAVAGKAIPKGPTFAVEARQVPHRMPMVFAVDAQKLLGIGLEGRVGQS
jgi:hypothetical protein